MKAKTILKYFFGLKPQEERAQHLLRHKRNRRTCVACSSQASLQAHRARICGQFRGRSTRREALNRR